MTSATGSPRDRDWRLYRQGLLVNIFDARNLLDGFFTSNSASLGDQRRAITGGTPTPPEYLPQNVEVMGVCADTIRSEL